MDFKLGFVGDSHKNDGSKGGEKLGEMRSEFFRAQRIEGFSFSSYKVSVPIQAPSPFRPQKRKIAPWGVGGLKEGRSKVLRRSDEAGKMVLTPSPKATADKSGG